MPSLAARPVQTLREHATALEAALSVCLADPDKRAVHKLRTETRRIEAQIALLKLMTGLPPFRAAATTLLKQSKKLRRAAGSVRDLDVQHKLIKDAAETVIRDAEERATLQKRFDELLASRDTVRAARAQELLIVLGKRQAKVAGALEALLHSLKTAETRILAASEMLNLVDRAFRATRALRIKAPTEDHLHTIRKAAKRARYQLETAPGPLMTRRAAKAYEALQDAGGSWHDWHELAQVALAEFGEHHRITAAFSAQCSRHLHAYERLLEEKRMSMVEAHRSATKPAKQDMQPKADTRSKAKQPDAPAKPKRRSVPTPVRIP